MHAPSKVTKAVNARDEMLNTLLRLVPTVNRI